MFSSVKTPDRSQTNQKPINLLGKQTMSTPLQQHEILFELVHDSVMTRTVEGIINFWNHSAEELYGWRKEEAIGRVSHNLLQTQFPQPLKAIDSELVRNGLWEGKLVHTTRDGGRVVVESRWTLRLNGQSVAVVEANTPSINSELDPEARTDATTTERKQAQDPLEQTVSSLQQHEILFELVHDSVMARTVEGIINFWNHSAEELYGWRKEEAIGRVSHTLLQTQFPKPLEEIESELVRDGRWEGKLVHTTRDGRRVVVQSRWILKTSGQSEAVIEINSGSTDRGSHSEARSVNDITEIGRPEPARAKLAKVTEAVANFWTRDGSGFLISEALVLLACILFVCVTLVWALYGWFGHDLIKTIYESGGIWPLDQIMRGKAITPLEAYYEEADRWLVVNTFRAVTTIIVLLAAIAFMRKPAGALVACCSSLFCSLILFSLLELYPSLVDRLHLDRISYYALRGCCIPDGALAYRYRPFFRSTNHGFRGYMYSPVYGVEVAPLTVELAADENGFIHNNNNAAGGLSDVVILGDSFIADGLNEADSFGRRLETISGLTTANLGIPGHGPFQYLEAFKRYGIQRKPRTALFAFYAGNDIDNIREFLQWKKGGKYYHAERGSKSFLTRYFEAVTSVARFSLSIRDTIGLTVLHTLTPAYYDIHPDLAVVKAEENTYRMLLPPENDIRSSPELLASPEGQALKEILSEFKDLCVKNGIVPVVMHIPTATTIYVDHVSDQSGKNMLRWRDEQIAQKRNIDTAVTDLARSLDMRLIDLTPAYEYAAKQGKLLYHQFDTHWNSEGRQVAAEYVGNILQSKETLRQSAVETRPEDKTSPR
jgi:PAS domain S-box-containing protein